MKPYSSFASEPSDCDPSQFPDLLETFESLVNDLETFLSDWVLSVEHATILSEAATAPEHALRKRIRAFELEKRQWEAARKHEARLARQRCEELAQAWLQLEAEQQQFFLLKQSYQPAAAAARSEFPPSPTVGSVNTASAATTAEWKGAAAIATAPASRPASMPPTAAAVQQFERLRREIDASGVR